MQPLVDAIIHPKCWDRKRTNLNERTSVATTKKARYVKKRGFVCGDHVLYCPDLTKANATMPFYLYCSRHGLMYEIDIPTLQQMG